MSRKKANNNFDRNCLIFHSMKKSAGKSFVAVYEWLRKKHIFLVKLGLICSNLGTSLLFNIEKDV